MPPSSFSCGKKSEKQKANRSIIWCSLVQSKRHRPHRTRVISGFSRFSSLFTVVSVGKRLQPPSPEKPTFLLNNRLSFPTVSLQATTLILSPRRISWGFTLTILLLRRHAPCVATTVRGEWFTSSSAARISESDLQPTESRTREKVASHGRCVCCR